MSDTNENPASAAQENECSESRTGNGCIEPALTSLLVEAIKEISSADAASILVPDGEGNLIFELVAGGAGLHLSQLKVPIESGVAGRVFTTGLPEIAHFPADSNASKLVERETGFVTKSLLAVPLVTENGTPFAVAEAVNPIAGAGPGDSFLEAHLRALLNVREPLADAFRALQMLKTDPSAMTRFYRAVVEVMDRRTEVLRQRNDDLHTSRRAFEMTRARHYSDEKMMALARMASGIAHEINNPLSVAVSNLGSLTETCSDLSIEARNTDEQELIDDVSEMTADVTTELNRINKIVSRLMFFGDRDVRTVECVNLEVEAKRIAAVISENQKVEIEVKCDDVPMVHAGRSQVRQVVLELIDNAAHAASRTTENKAKVEVRVFASGGTVHASVGDNGPGIDPKNIERVFEPFFTCKSDWHSTGLGLTAAYGVMQAMGGQIAIDSVPGRGTIVVASFPVEQSQAVETPGDSEPDQASDSERAKTWSGLARGRDGLPNEARSAPSGRYYDDLSS